MAASHVSTAKALYNQWPLLSEINLVAMIASTLNVSFEQAQALLAQALA